MSSSGAANSVNDASKIDLGNLQISESKKKAREKSIKNQEFLTAIRKNNINDVNSLLKEVDINFKDQDGFTPLHWAVEAGDVKIIENLISNEADLRSKNNDNDTPIDLAKQMNRLDIVDILETSLSHAVDEPKVDEIKSTSDRERKPSLRDQEIVWINPVHGYMYQMKVLMLFLHRGLSCNYSFNLGTEIKKAKKFDDIVFEYTHEDRKFYRLLQAKHKFDESKKITVDKLLMDTKGDYSLVKYFDSFQACKEENFFKDGIIKDVIICTNIDFDWEDLKKYGIEMKKLEDKDDILDIRSSEKVPTRYKFTDSTMRKLKAKLKPGESDDEIRCFLNHLVFAVNQPNEEELGQIIKTEIGNEIGFLDTENAYNKLLIKLMDLSLGKSTSMFLSHEEGKKFFDELKRDIPIWFNIQEPVASFTGRSGYLKKMHKKLKNSSVCISGMGGVGKTELVRKYIAIYGHEYNNQVIWINAESHRSTSDSFRHLASDKLNISLNTFDGKEKLISSIITDVYQFLSKDKSLFIFDNAEKYKCVNESDCGIDQFLPRLPDNCVKPNIIITSRNQKWPESIKTMVLKAFTADEARELVEKVLRFDNDNEKELIVELGEKLQFLPLAMQQAIAYIKMKKEKLTCIDSKFEINSYLAKYSDMTHELLDFKFSEDSDGNYDISVFATWNITFDTLKQKENGQDALDILNIISYFLPDNIPIELLLIFSPNREKLSSAIVLLKQFSIVTVQHKALSLHRLVQQITRIKLQKENKEGEILQNFLKLFLDKDNVTLQNLDQVISLWSFSSKHSELFGEYLSLALLIVLTLSECGRFDEAISMGNEVFTLFRTMPKTVIYLHTYSRLKYNVALCISKKGDLETALKELQDVHELQTTRLGLEPSHAKVLDTQNSIANILVGLNKYSAALEYYFKQLDILRVNFEESHPRILLVKSNISFTLTEEGRHAEALSMLNEIYEVQEKVLGTRHKDTLAIKNNIALALVRLNRTEEALKIWEELLICQEAILPKNHIDVLIIKRNIAHALSKQKKYSAALKLYEEVFDIQNKKFGEDNTTVIHISLCIASILKQQGNFEKALEVMKNSLKKLENIYGLEHPKIYHTQSEIVDVLFNQKRYEESAELNENLLKRQICALGNVHPTTIDTRRKKLKLLFAQKKDDAALEVALRLLHDVESIYGKGHPSTLGCKSNVGTIYCHSRTTCNEGLAILQEVLEAQESFFGKDHINCEKTRCNIENCHAMQILDKKDDDRRIAEVEQTLKERGDINFKNEEGMTLLHQALDYDDGQVIEFLLQRKAEIFVTSNMGITPLHLAATKGQERFVKLLLQEIKPGRLNDFVDAKTTVGGSITALHVAAREGHFGIVKCLLKNHATFCVKNQNGKTPLDLTTDANIANFLKMVGDFFENVKQAHISDVIKKLGKLSAEEFLAVANTRNEQGSTLVQVAILNKQREIATNILKMVQESKSK